MQIITHADDIETWKIFSSSLFDKDFLRVRCHLFWSRRAVIEGRNLELSSYITCAELLCVTLSEPWVVLSYWSRKRPYTQIGLAC